MDYISRGMREVARLIRVSAAIVRETFLYPNSNSILDNEGQVLERYDKDGNLTQIKQ